MTAVTESGGPAIQAVEIWTGTHTSLHSMAYTNVNAVKVDSAREADLINQLGGLAVHTHIYCSSSLPVVAH